MIDGRVRFSEIDHTRKITVPSIINYFQDCSTFQSEDIGVGLDVLSKKKKAWILTYWQIVIDHYPKMNDKIQVSTWASKFKGMLACGIVLNDLGIRFNVSSASIPQKGENVKVSIEDVLVDNLRIKASLTEKWYTDDYHDYSRVL